MARLPRYLYGGFNNPLAGPARYVVCALPHVKVVANRRPTSNRHPDFFATKRTNHPPKITPPDCLPNVDFDAKDFARAKFGTHRDFGLYTDDEANYSRVFWWYFWEVPLFAGLGALGGLCGALFVKLNVRITSLRYVLHFPNPASLFYLSAGDCCPYIAIYNTDTFLAKLQKTKIRTGHAPRETTFGRFACWGFPKSQTTRLFHRLPGDGSDRSRATVQTDGR